MMHFVRPISADVCATDLIPVAFSFRLCVRFSAVGSPAATLPCRRRSAGGVLCVPLVSPPKRPLLPRLRQRQCQSRRTCPTGGQSWGETCGHLCKFAGLVGRTSGRVGHRSAFGRSTFKGLKSPPAHRRRVQSNSASSHFMMASFFVASEQTLNRGQERVRYYICTPRRRS